jgi:hypothetical protein
MGAARLRERPLLLLTDSLRPSDPECENSDNRRDLMGLENEGEYQSGGPHSASCDLTNITSESSPFALGKLW